MGKMNWLLVAASAISYFIGDYTDAVAIVAIVFLNAGITIYQEYKSEKALSTLRKMAIFMVRVIRNGVESQIDSRQLVVGDKVFLEEGGRVPADCVVTQSTNLELDESVLTGESMPVSKKNSDEIFMGSVVAKGQAYATVLRTGDQTKFGQIAKKLGEIKDPLTPLQKKLGRLTGQVGLLGLVAALIILAISLSKGEGLAHGLLLSVSLAVAAVPEGLPSVMTITLAMGVERLAKRKAIVRKMPAIETLGAITLIATDKTGTLTTNNMRVKKVWSVSKKDEALMALNGILCSTASVVTKIDHGTFDVIGDPTEGSLLYWAADLGMMISETRDEWKTLEVKPFDSKTKTMEVTVQKGSEKYVFIKGSPESILGMCKSETTAKKEKIQSEFSAFAKQGYRMIAMAAKKGNGKLRFLGFVGIADPVRPEVKGAIAATITAGIKTVMVTGDNVLTAEAIGREVGIIHEGEDILTGAQLNNYSDEELLAILPRVRIFARTEPEQKYRLVKLYQKLGEVVAVTGDGVNDVLALKQADVGVAMGKQGTDVARQTADMILTDDNFATLVNAIEEGRNIFSNLVGAIKFLLACNLGEVAYITMAALFDLPMLTPFMILYINLVTDGLPALAFAFANKIRGLMSGLPRNVDQFLGIVEAKYMVGVGLMLAALSFGSTWVFGLESSMASGVLFTSMILLQFVVFVDCFINHKSVFSSWRMFGNLAFLAAALIPLAIHPLIADYITPLPNFAFLYSFGFAGLFVVILETRKQLTKRL